MTHMVCLNCSATNRIPDGRALSSAKCGRCGQRLFTGQPADVSAAILEKHIAKSDIPVLVDVWAPWCGPCKVMGPQFEAAAKLAEPRFRFVKLNSDDNQALSRLGIRGIPTMIMFRHGKEVARVSGAMSITDILGWAAEMAS
ncbi:thioredoxin TrxC [Devosia sp. FJ2-5-3]|jgi:thioredoxin 2|uniref:thioredoxin TrxC n=1 Tax=Devosia sp. FJ2-5-3 TaxID=2976680 RepID=UPI0023D7FA61|nr:thioredoxin TrxC [Devosia sp. FJ2-5-3]WEJ56872.1 thioredoxin TrxC [Devosia sp. FJ2-5-3]